MHGLLSLLDQTHETLVYQLWQELENSCRMTGVMVTPFPHFSWLIAEDFDWIELEAVLKEITAGIHPFTVQTTGLSMFTGEDPVVYIPLVRTGELSRIHKTIWDRVTPLGTEVSPFYAPPFWMPHITIGFGDVTRKTLPCLLELLSARTFNWEIEIDNISIGFQSPGTTAVISNRYEFKL
jgi:2'-5' RNA ligase